MPTTIKEHVQATRRANNFLQPPIQGGHTRNLLPTLHKRDKKTPRGTGGIVDIDATVDATKAVVGKAARSLLSALHKGEARSIADVDQPSRSSNAQKLVSLVLKGNSDETLPSFLHGKDVATSMRELGFQPHRPIVALNSMVGSMLSCFESESRPDWVGVDIVLDLAKVIGTFSNNMLGTLSPEVWKSVLLDQLDKDQDGLEVDELKDFVEADPVLADDPEVKAAIARAEAAEATGGNVLDAVKDVSAKLRAAVTRMQAAEEGGLAAKRAYAQGAFAQHLTLRDGYKDPVNIKLRPPKYDDDPTKAYPGGSGIQAILYLLNVPLVRSAAALFGPLLLELKKFGYVEGKDLFACPFDWRCAVSKLEERDSYFTALTHMIKTAVETHPHKARAVLVAHSMGTLYSHYYLHWMVESAQGKALGGQAFLDKYVHSFVPIAGPFLGAVDGIGTYLQPGPCEGLAPAVMTFQDGHACVRSWGSMPILFGAEKIAANSGATHFCYTRVEGCLQVEMIDATLPAEHHDSDTYAELTFLGHGMDQKLTTAIKRGANPSYNEVCQFAWVKDAESLKGATLRLRIIKKTAVSHATLAETDIKLSGAQSESTGITSLEGGTSISLAACNWFSIEAPIGKGVSAEFRLHWIPPKQLPSGFDDVLIPRDKAGLAAKAKAMQGLGTDLSSWEPTSSKGYKYVARTVEDMFALEDMPDSFRMWKGCYTDDPIWVKCQQKAPPVKQVLGVYGVNYKKGTPIAFCYRRDVKAWPAGKRLCYMVLDEDATSNHPGYQNGYNGRPKGMTSEVPGKAVQSSTPDTPSFGQVFASGDGTVPYASLNYIASWGSANCEVECVEVDGAGHRTVLKMPAAHFTILQHVARVPRIDLQLVGCAVPTPAAGAGGKVAVRLDWGDHKWTASALAASECTGQTEEIKTAWSGSKGAFTIGADPKDVGRDLDKMLDVTMVDAVSGKELAGTKVASIGIATLIEAGAKNATLQIKLGEGAVVHAFVDLDDDIPAWRRLLKCV